MRTPQFATRNLCGLGELNQEADDAALTEGNPKPLSGEQRVRVDVRRRQIVENAPQWRLNRNPQVDRHGSVAADPLKLWTSLWIGAGEIIQVDVPITSFSV